MTKRRTYKFTGDVKASIVEYREAVKAMTSEELYREATRLGGVKSECRDRLAKANVMLDIIRDAIQSKRSDPEDFGVSEHAVLRYLERVKGLDVRAIKTEIRQYARQFERADELDQIVTTPDELKIALSNSGTVTTVWAERALAPPSTDHQ